MLMAAEVARCMRDPNVRDPRDDATQVELADKWLVFYSSPIPGGSEIKNLPAVQETQV